MVDAMRDEYQAKCLTPLDSCTPSPEGLRAFVRPQPTRAALIADTAKEILATRNEAIVVPEGTFSRCIKQINVIARYKRQGNLYVNRVRARAAPKGFQQGNVTGKQKAEGFTRPVSRR